jgi:CheY-like chemotaxis protein
MPSGVEMPSSQTMRVGDRSKPTVLVVEDDADLRISLKNVFDDEGFVTLVANNGKSAIELLRSDGHPRPGVILLDLMMPVMNGWDFLDCLGRDASLADIPVIVMTAFHSVLKHERVTQALRKPVHLESLLRAVRKAC